MVQAQRTVLYIAHADRPSGKAGGIRAERFVNALTKHGLGVMTTVCDAASRIERVGPQVVIGRFSSPKNVPQEVRQSGARRWPFWSVLPGPDTDWQYCRGVYPVCNWLLRQQPVDLIYVMTPAFCLATIAHRLAREHNLPLIVEFDDAWYTGMYWPYPHALARGLARYWERRCVFDAQAIVTVTETHKRILGQKFGPAIAQKITNIPHSFDPSLSCRKAGLDDGHSLGERSDQRLFRVAYVGQVRGNDLIDVPRAKRLWRLVHSRARRFLFGARFCEKLQLEWMSPYYLLSAMARVAQEDRSFAERLRLDFIGEEYAEIDVWARQMNLSGNVKQHGVLSPGQAQQFVDGADVLVVNLYGITGLDYHWCIPTKAYTYLGAGKAILGLLPAGEARDIIQKAGAGFFAAPNDIGAIARQLSELFHAHTHEGIKLALDWDYINQFDLGHQEKRFTDIVDSVLNK